MSKMRLMQRDEVDPTADNIGPGLRVFGIVLLALASFGVFTRWIARWSACAQPSQADWLILSGLVSPPTNFE